MSIKRLGGRTGESRLVSSSPSKIPYGGFSPVRLQTGYWPWRPSPAHRSAVSARHASTQRRNRLIRHHPPSAGSPMVLSDMVVGSVARTPPVQRPLARQRVVLSHQVIAYYGRMRVSRALPPIYGFIQRICPCQSHPGSSREVPQFTLLIFPSVPSSIPRWIGKVHLTVSSPPALTFASFSMSRHPKYPTQSDSTWGLHEAAKFTSCYGPAGLLALHRSGLLRSSFHSLPRHRKRRV